MNQRSLTALIAINVVLLTALVFSVTVFTPQLAQAQFGGNNQYLMISGAVVGREQQNAIYIINRNTSRMVAILFNTANDKMDFIDGRDIKKDGQTPVR
jgi:hypothetical protein